MIHLHLIYLYLDIDHENQLSLVLRFRIFFNFLNGDSLKAFLESSANHLVHSPILFSLKTNLL